VGKFSSHGKTFNVSILLFLVSALSKAGAIELEQGEGLQIANIAPGPAVELFI
jgi:hypothetical protein